jgi:hypothetical protein
MLPCMYLSGKDAEPWYRKWMVPLSDNIDRISLEL